MDGHKIDVVDEFRYLGNESKRDNSVLCETTAKKSIGTISKLISLCKVISFGKRQLTNMIILDHSVFVPRLIYNAEVWYNLTK